MPCKITLLNTNFAVTNLSGLNYIVLHILDYSSGFGGKYGVQKDRVDKSAVGWDHVEKIDKHESQKGLSIS